MKCQLCLQDKKLLKKSHIIPDFMYQEIYDDKHFLSKVDLRSLEIVQKRPSGFYDKNILCDDCDNRIISQYESYGSKVLYGGNPPKEIAPIFEHSKLQDQVNVTRIDYTKFKLFLLSIIWRAHISKQEFFYKVDLGPYAEKLRKMVFNGNAGEENEFETCIVSYQNPELPLKTLTPIRKFKIECNTSYLLHIGGLSYYFNISPHNKLAIFKSGRIKKNNSTVIFLPKGKKANEFFKLTTGIQAEI